MSNKETVRVQFELPQPAIERLKALKDKTEASSYAEVVKSSLKLYEFLIEITKNGNKFQIVDSKGDVYTITVI